MPRSAAKEGDDSATPRASNGSIVFLVATALAIGLAVGGLSQWNTTPPSLTHSENIDDSVQVASVTLDDSHEVELAITAGLPVTVHSNVAGVLTASACRPAETVSSGDVVARVGRARVVVLATSTPLWRDLRRGSTGKDAAGLNRALVRLGLLDKTNKDRITSATMAAAAKLAGLPTTTSVIPVGTFAWIPEATGVWASCTAGVGDRVGAGAEIGRLSPAPQRISLKATPTDPLPGDRELVIGETVVAIGASGITKKQDLRRIQDTQAYQLWEQSGGAVALSGQWRLQSPLTVSSVPASAIVTTGARSCVLTAGAPVGVTVVSSSLGRSMVRFEGTPPERVDLAPRQGAICP